MENKFLNLIQNFFNFHKEMYGRKPTYSELGSYCESNDIPEHTLQHWNKNKNRLVNNTQPTIKRSEMRDTSSTKKFSKSLVNTKNTAESLTSPVVGKILSKSLERKKKLRLSPEDMKYVEWGKTVVMSIRDFLKEYHYPLSLEHNARKAGKNVSKDAYYSMKETLKENPSAFIIQNTSGITIVNNRFNVNGGHTELAIRDALKEGADYSLGGEVIISHVTINDSVPLEYFKDLIKKVSATRNTGKSVTKSSLVNLAGGFDGLKDCLKQYRNNFEFKDGENSEDIINKYKPGFVLAILNAPTAKTEQGALMSWNNHGVMVQNHSDFPDRFNSVANLLPVYIRLYSRIYRYIASMKEGKLDGIHNRNKKTYALPDNSFTEYEIADAYIWPIMYAFSAVYELKDQWDDPDELEEKIEQVIDFATKTTVIVGEHESKKVDENGKPIMIKEKKTRASVLDVLWYSIKQAKGTDKMKDYAKNSTASYTAGKALVKEVLATIDKETAKKAEEIALLEVENLKQQIKELRAGR